MRGGAQRGRARPAPLGAGSAPQPATSPATPRLHRRRPRHRWRWPRACGTLLPPASPAPTPRTTTTTTRRRRRRKRERRRLHYQSTRAAGPSPRARRQGGNIRVPRRRLSPRRLRRRADADAAAVSASREVGVGERSQRGHTDSRARVPSIKQKQPHQGCSPLCSLECNGKREQKCVRCSGDGLWFGRASLGLFAWLARLGPRATSRHSDPLSPAVVCPYGQRTPCAARELPAAPSAGSS